MAFSLGLLGYVWPAALHYKSFAHSLLVVSQYDAVGECCGTRRMVDYMQELAARHRNGGTIADNSVNTISSSVHTQTSDVSKIDDKKAL